MIEIKTLVEHGYIVTMDPQRKTYEDGSLVIDGDKIVYIGRSNGLKKRYKPDRIINAKHHMVLPGLINTHTHLYQVLARSTADDMKLFDWYPKVIGPLSGQMKKEDIYYSAVMGCIELLKSGCTCTLDNFFAHTSWGLTDEIMKAFQNIGIRGIEAMGADVKETPDFPIPAAILKDPKEYLKENERVLKDWHGKSNGRLQVWFGGAAPFAMDDDTLERSHDLARKYGVGVCCHLHETKDEIDQFKKDHGLTPIQYYWKNIRFLDDNLIAIHCVWMEDKDIQALRETNTKVSHNPVSNMYLASGVAPVPKMLREGITVSLGVDGAASNNNQDMIETLKTTALLQKVSTLDPVIINAHQVLELATLHGAQALGLEHEIGSLEIGKKADIVLIDLKGENIVPLNNPISQLVYCGRSHNVKTVIVDGNIVVENRIIKTASEEQIADKTEELAKALCERAGINL